ncbi:hypothetical protein HPB47_026300 [Ixodes persulcatus]|uniref:Uncharacterized protein n=1 Tax=Ixodes persulcatus TaxID=34615 RepID=A0AC60PZ51_IXOPE|nr:hypothetical protein HPB47_026300 [Ixodes persulcatus]
MRFRCHRYGTLPTTYDVPADGRDGRWLRRPLAVAATTRKQLRRRNEKACDLYRAFPKFLAVVALYVLQQRKDFDLALPDEEDTELEASSTSKGKKRKSYQKKTPKKKQRASLENTDVMNEDEIQDGHSVWNTAKPSKIVTAPKMWDPIYSTKAPTKPIDTFKLFFG